MGGMVLNVPRVDHVVAGAVQVEPAGLDGGEGLGVEAAGLLVGGRLVAQGREEEPVEGDAEVDEGRGPGGEGLGDGAVDALPVEVTRA